MDILIVDHSLVDAYLSKTALEDGFPRARIHIVHDGVEALAFLRQQHAYHTAPRSDVLVLDLYLPNLAGLQLIVNRGWCGRTRRARYSDSRSMPHRPAQRRSSHHRKH